MMATFILRNNELINLFQDNFYAVFVEVAKFRKWIDDNISANGGATYC